MHPRLQEIAESPIEGVRVWLSELDVLSDAELPELRAHLNPAERARAERFHFEHDRRHYSATRGLLRSLLSEMIGRSAAEIEFTYGEHGKPAIAAHPSIHFNVSHSAGWAMFAVSRERAVGIDLESAARLEPNETKLAELAARVLSAGELAGWRGLPDAEARRLGFLRAWTRKEAYLKARGRGVFDHLAEIELALDADRPAKVLRFSPAKAKDSLTNSWVLHDLAAPAGFAAALAIEESAAPAFHHHAQGSTARHF